MRFPWVWVVSVPMAMGVVACAGEEGDGSEDQTQDVTGGSSRIESPVVYLFDGPDKGLAPKCAGALLGEKVAVTVKACAKTGMVIGRADDEDGKGTRGTITQVHTPEAPDADIAIVELDREIGGTRALITHAPLKDGYAVNGIASVDGSGLFAPDTGEASSVTGKMVSETDTHGSLIPSKGSQICAGDLGAPVCSSTATQILSFNIRGTCGLSGLIVGAEDAPPIAPSATRERPSTTTGEQPAPAAPAPTGCSAGAWKVVQLGRYAEFIKRFAPDAFKPLVIDLPIVRNFPHIPEGLWGYESGGDVRSCKIETAKLDATPIGKEAKITAKASFANMQERAAAFGRFGIAHKSAPTKIRWLPAQAAVNAKNTAFESSFEGAVSADKEGDYIVLFRASANGGETWTVCDTDGSENGMSLEKALALRIGAALPSGTTPTPTDPTKPADGATNTTTPPSTPKSGSTSTYSDPPSSTQRSEDKPSGGDEPSLTPKKKKKTDSSGCSASAGSSGGGLHALGLLLAVAAVLRRRSR